MSSAAQTESINAAWPTYWSIEPTGFWSPHFRLFQGDQHIATLHMGLWREGADFNIAGHEFQIRRSSIWTDGFKLLAGDATVCEVKRHFWSRRFELNAGGQQWALQPASWFSTTYNLLSGEQKLGDICRRGVFARKRTAHFAQSVPPPIQVLAIFLVLIVAQRQSKAH
jgi:hypothetical protein